MVNRVMKKSDLKKHIRDIPDFPKEGIIFKDITTLLKDKDAFKKSIDLLAKKFKNPRRQKRSERPSHRDRMCRRDSLQDAWDSRTSS